MGRIDADVQGVMRLSIDLKCIADRWTCILGKTKHLSSHLVDADVEGVVRLGVDLEAHFWAGQGEGALLLAPRPQHPRHLVERPQPLRHLLCKIKVVFDIRIQLSGTRATSLSARSPSDTCCTEFLTCCLANPSPNPTAIRWTVLN